MQNGKPGGQVYLVDFGGVQAAAASQGSMPFASTIIGTYGYMAPEQFQGSASHASDLYSLGGTLLYLLTGLLWTTYRAPWESLNEVSWNFCCSEV